MTEDFENVSSYYADFLKYQKETEEQIYKLAEEIESKVKLINPIILVSNLNHKMINSVQSKKYAEELPTDFARKFLYIYGLIAKQSLRGGELDAEYLKEQSWESDVESIISLTNQLYSSYADLWTYRPSISGSFDRNEIEDYQIRYLSFLIALLQDELGYSEQFKDRMSDYFSPFNDSFFKPKYKFTIEDCLKISVKIVDIIRKQYVEYIKHFHDIIRPYEECRQKLLSGEMTLTEIKQYGKDNPIDIKLLNENSRMFYRSFIIKKNLFLYDYKEEIIDAYFNCFAFNSGEINQNFRHPTDYNELAIKIFERIAPDNYLVYNPSYLFVRLYTAIESIVILSELQIKYYKNRDKVTEAETRNNLCKIFPEEGIYQNAFYGWDNVRDYETDFIILHNRKLIICEVKAKSLRDPLYTYGNTDKIRNDFKVSIQKAYEQTIRTRDYILSEKNARFVDERGKHLCIIPSDAFDSIILLVITAKSFGQLATDLTLLLKKHDKDPYPIVFNVFDFQLLVNKLNSPDKFIDYCIQRSKIYGIVISHDELDYVGYYIEYGSLDFSLYYKQDSPDQIMLDGNYSEIFDDDWRREQGLDFEISKDNNGPYLTEIKRQDNKITIGIKGMPETYETLDLTEPAGRFKPIKKIKGRGRNLPCPCGSGKKYKHCCREME
ncbi:MAG: SEC-C domain-containing protein [candidate division Zixibacteria bacterium]|nr:SEC-C domain-containing protein [Candidatus Tariuqbacter arcticus]